MPTDILLADALAFMVQTIQVGGMNVCKATRWHAEPEKLICCDCSTGTPGFTVVAWIVRSYDSDVNLLEALPNACPTLRATELGFTVSRCWPIINKMSTEVDARDEASADLAKALDVIDAALCACDAQPSGFRASTMRFAHSGFRPRRNFDETPYGQEGTVTYGCAGWQFSLTVA